MSRGPNILANLPRVNTARQPESTPYEPVCAVFRRYLHGKKLKFTPERAMILDAALRRSGLFEAEQLAGELERLAQPMIKNGYGEYLMSVLRERVF